MQVKVEPYNYQPAIYDESFQVLALTIEFEKGELHNIKKLVYSNWRLYAEGVSNEIFKDVAEGLALGKELLDTTNPAKKLLLSKKLYGSQEMFNKLVTYKTRTVECETYDDDNSVMSVYYRANCSLFQMVRDYLSNKMK